MIIRMTVACFEIQGIIVNPYHQHKQDGSCFGLRGESGYGYNLDQSKRSHDVDTMCEKGGMTSRRNEKLTNSQYGRRQTYPAVRDSLYTFYFQDRRTWLFAFAVIVGVRLPCLYVTENTVWPLMK